MVWDITWIQEYVEDTIWNSLVWWTDISVTYNDATWETTIDYTWAWGWAVDSVNGLTGVVVLDADDIDDFSTTNKFVTAWDLINLGNLSWTNTGDQNLFSKISVAWQSDVIADSTSDTLTLVAWSNITITTDAWTDTITIDASWWWWSIWAPVAYNPTSWEVISGTATLTLTYNTTVGIVTVNWLVLNDTEYAQSGYTLTVTPVNGFADITDEILVFQYTLVVPTNNIQNLTLQNFYVDTIVDSQITEAHREDGTTVENTYNISNKLETAVYTFPDTSTLTLTITYDIDGNVSTALYS